MQAIEVEECSTGYHAVFLGSDLRALQPAGAAAATPAPSTSLFGTGSAAAGPVGNAGPVAIPAAQGG